MNKKILTASTATVLITLMAAAGSAVAGDTYYRWKDDRGNPVHSDRPPPSGIEYEVVSTRTTLVRKVDSSAAAAGSTAPTAPPATQTETASSTAPTPQNEEYCQNARANLETLNSKARVRTRNAEGEVVFLSDEEKEKEKERAQDIIDAHCSS